MIQPHNVSASDPMHESPVPGSPASGNPVPGSPIHEDLEPAGPEVQWPDAAAPTGDPLVDRALGLLDTVPATPAADHGDLFSMIHDSLLEALETEPGLPAPRQSSPRPEGDS